MKPMAKSVQTNAQKFFWITTASPALRAPCLSAEEFLDHSHGAPESGLRGPACSSAD
jgi:hypothetical protein